MSFGGVVELGGLVVVPQGPQTYLVIGHQTVVGGGLGGFLAARATPAKLSRDRPTAKQSNEWMSLFIFHLKSCSPDDCFRIHLDRAGGQLILGSWLSVWLGLFPKFTD